MDVDAMIHHPNTGHAPPWQIRGDLAERTPVQTGHTSYRNDSGGDLLSHVTNSGYRGIRWAPTVVAATAANSAH
jgi:hypothetical protein